MEKKSLFFLTTIVLLSGILPAFAEVAELQLDKNYYIKGDSIIAQGTVSKDTSGLVTIVLRDPNDKFVLLSQALIQSDDSFEKAITINEKFQVLGTYNATAFVLNMTAGKTQSFDFDTSMTEKNPELDEGLLSDIEEFERVINEKSEIENTPIEEKLKVEENQIEKEYEIEIPQKDLAKNKSQIADFVDPNKKPEYYLDRYYNEPVYQSWFDKNYPKITIEEAVGYIIPTKSEIEFSQNIEEPKIIPEAEALSTVTSTSTSEDNADVAQVGLALGGLVILFGAVYGIKKKVDVNSKHISLNKDLIKRKIISPIIDSNPIGIIQTRLAKGEISIEEYEKLKQKLDKNSK
jgi:hypothetical protein